MQSSFENGTCPKCKHTSLAHIAMWITGTIPAGVEGEIACRNCLYWETLLTIAPAENIFDTEHWIVLEAGQGTYRDQADKARVVTYRDADAARYPRHQT